MQNKHAIKLLVALLTAATLSACNGGSATTSSTNTVTSTSPLAQYKALLDYSPNTANTGNSLQATGDTKQQAFSVVSGTLSLDAVRVTLFSTTNCAYGSATAIITMNGGSGTAFPNGTYTSSNASNYALSQRFTTESSAASLEAQSIRFDYQFSATNNGPGWVSAGCMQNTGIGNYNTNPAEACTSGQPCGFNAPQLQVLPSVFLRAIIVTANSYTGDLKSAAITNGGIGVATGFTGADYLCNINSSIPIYGHGSHWKALLNNNASTTEDVNYYKSDYSTLIAFATGSNFRDFGQVSYINTPISEANNVWTGFTPSMDLTYSGWSEQDNGAADNSCNDWGGDVSGNGIIGMAGSDEGAQDDTSAGANAGWNAAGVSTCSTMNHLYCVQQSY